MKTPSDDMHRSDHQAGVGMGYVLAAICVGFFGTPWYGLLAGALFMFALSVRSFRKAVDR